jgi:hypothetical protein
MKGEKLGFLPANLILATYGYDGQTLLYDCLGTGYFVQENLTEVEAGIRKVAPDYPHFLRVNRQNLANMSFVKDFDKPNRLLTLEVLKENAKQEFEDELEIDKVPRKKFKQVDEYLYGVCNEEEAQDSAPPFERNPSLASNAPNLLGYGLNLGQLFSVEQNSDPSAQASLAFILGFLSSVPGDLPLPTFEMQAGAVSDIGVVLSNLKELGSLKKMGSLPEDEFQKIKAQLLEQL